MSDTLKWDSQDIIWLEYKRKITEEDERIIDEITLEICE